MVSPVNSTVINVSWSEIQCLNGNEAVTYYLVKYQPLHGGAVQNVTTNCTVHVVSGLTPNYVYTFRVAAVGASQKIGPFSNPVNASLPGVSRRYILLDVVMSVLTIVLISLAQHLGGSM